MGFGTLPSFFLNLARRPDRRIRTQEQFRREKLDILRVAAPDAVGVMESRGWRNKGARACATGHRLAWREAMKSGKQAVLVFEDDVVLCQGFRERLAKLELPEDWRVLYFGCVFRTPPEEVGQGLLRVTGATWDMHGYIIRREWSEELSRELSGISCRSLPVHGTGIRPLDAGWWELPPRERGRMRAKYGSLEHNACDVVLADYHRRGGAYAVWPPMAWQVTGLSNNENTVRGNYRADGTQAIYREMIGGLPGVAEARDSKKESGGEGETKGRGGAEAALEGISVDGTSFYPAVAGEEEAIAGGSQDGTVACRAKTADADSSREHAWGREKELLPESGSKGKQGFLVSPFSPASERMAYGLVCSLRRYNTEVPVCVLGQDYVCTLPWRGLAQVKTVRAAGAHGSDEQWFNKLGALLKSPYEETIFLDCDMVLLSDPAWWFESLGTDDFTCFNRVLTPHLMPRETVINVVNVHRMQEEFGVDGVPVIDGGGHFFVRRTDRGRRLVEATAEIMAAALRDGPASLYHRMAGPGNCAASDEIAYSIAVVQQGIRTPAEQPASRKPISVFLPPHQHHEFFDLLSGMARFYDEWTGAEVQPGAVHFCHASKTRPEYVAYVADCLRLGRSPLPEDAVSRGTTTVDPRPPARHVPADKTKFLFDLGYHQGEGMAYLRRLYRVDGQWRVFAVEPNSRCRDSLDLAAGNGAITFPLAAHTEAGPAIFQRESTSEPDAEDGQGSHLRELQFHLDPQGGGQEVIWKMNFPLFLRSLIPPGRQHSFVVVKMDIEGAEYDILRAMLTNGSIDLVDVLHVEFHDRLMPGETAETTEALKTALRKRVDLVEHW